MVRASEAQLQSESEYLDSRPGWITDDETSDGRNLGDVFSKLLDDYLAARGRGVK